jgi:hypothetical protein
MRLIPFLLASAVSFTSAETNWTFERQGLTAILSDPAISASPLRLSCAQRGYLEISILAWRVLQTLESSCMAVA